MVARSLFAGVKSPYFLWLLLSLPALGMFSALTGTDARAFRHLLEPTGEFAARFMIIGMMATPLMMVFRTHHWPRWMMHNRRYFGVAAFGYAALHTIVYVVSEGTLAKILGEITKFEIWTGWLAFLIFIPLAATSMDYAQRALGTAWKPLQRWTYAAAVLTLLHWASLHNWGSIAPAAIHFGPLAALSAYRLWYWYLRPRPTRIA
ncbi:MAG: ferric reductase-like transmembrane domain-containing protein [Paracoccaceae bacterium]